MAYTVGKYEERTFGEREPLREGTQILTIGYVSTKPQEKDGMQVPKISIALNNSYGESSWDTIYSNVDTNINMYVLDENKMNAYSIAVAFAEGTVFNTIEDWATSLKGKSIMADVVLTDRGYVRINNVRHIESHLPY